MTQLAPSSGLHPRVLAVHSRAINTLALVEYCDGRYLEMLKNGLFGAVEVFNRLPEDMVRLPSVNAFQSALTQTARSVLLNGQPRWPYLFSGRVLY